MIVRLDRDPVDRELLTHVSLSNDTVNDDRLNEIWLRTCVRIDRGHHYCRSYRCQAANRMPYDRHDRNDRFAYGVRQSIRLIWLPGYEEHKQNNIKKFYKGITIITFIFILKELHLPNSHYKD